MALIELWPLVEQLIQAVREMANAGPERRAKLLAQTEARVKGALTAVEGLDAEQAERIRRLAERLGSESISLEAVDAEPSG